MPMIPGGMAAGQMNMGVAPTNMGGDAESGAVAANPMDMAGAAGAMEQQWGTGMDPLEHLRAAIEHAQAALVMEPDDIDSQLLSKVVSGLYQILANRQKEQDQALGNPGLMRTLRRS